MPRVAMARLDGSKLRNAIAERGLSPTSVAARAGVSGETVRQAMRGRPIGRLTAGAIAKVVRLQLGALIAETPAIAGPQNAASAAARSARSERT